MSITGNSNLVIKDVATLEATTENDISFLSNPKYINYFTHTKVEVPA